MVRKRSWEGSRERGTCPANPLSPGPALSRAFWRQWLLGDVIRKLGQQASNSAFWWDVNQVSSRLLLFCLAEERGTLGQWQHLQAETPRLWTARGWPLLLLDWISPSAARPSLPFPDPTVHPGALFSTQLWLELFLKICFKREKITSPLRALRLPLPLPENGFPSLPDESPLVLCFWVEEAECLRLSL